MRRTTIKMLLLTTTLWLSACASTEAGAQAAVGPCAKLNRPGTALKLQLDEFELVLKRKKAMCLDFRKGKSGTFRIRVDAGDSGYTWADGPIKVEGKSTATGAPLISGSNSAADPEMIEVTVTDASVPGPNSSDYAYWIKVPGVGTLDPKVRIIRQNTAPLWSDDVVEALFDKGFQLEDLGLNREELESLMRRKLESDEPVQAY